MTEKRSIIKSKKILSHVKRIEETFGDTEIIQKNHCYKSPIFLEDVDIENVLASNNISSAEKNYKYFIGYLCDDYKIKLLHMMLPKKSVYEKRYDGQTKWMYFLIEDMNY